MVNVGKYTIHGWYGYGFPANSLFAIVFLIVFYFSLFRKKKGETNKTRIKSSLIFFNELPDLCSIFWGDEMPIHIRSIRLVWLVVSTHLKNISQIGNLPQIEVNMKII